MYGGSHSLSVADHEGVRMPFVNIALARGKSAEYLQAVSRAVHDALVAEFGMIPEDKFQLIRQHEPGEMIFHPNFRGGPRSEDWIMLTITDGRDRGERAKRRFYQTLVQLLEKEAGVRPADVFVIVTITAPENFSFAGGAILTDVLAAEALAASSADSGSRAAYTKPEMIYAIGELFDRRDSTRILPMLRDDFVMKIPSSLSYGGDYIGRQAFAKHFAGVPGGDAVWDSFEVHLDQIIDGGDYLMAQLTNTVMLKGGGAPVVIKNLWLFEVANGRFVSTQLYADTAAARSTTG
jgi:ketosteroid isomerase-like protein